MDVSVAGTDNHLWDKVYTNGNWGSWTNLGGTLYSSPTVGSWGANRLDVFVEGPNATVYHDAYGGAWSGFQTMNATTYYAPATVSRNPGQVDLFYADVNNAIEDIRFG
ncbi:MAG TPA: hypothetical protein VNG13_13095 [Mycobacteriales bacterium]|nr:hypothetical protein [Mycobacteriales bacterium]